MTMLLIAVVILVLLEITLKALNCFRRSAGLDWLPPTVNTDQVIDALPGVSERISTAPVWTAYGLWGKSVSDRTLCPDMTTVVPTTNEGPPIKREWRNW